MSKLISAIEKETNKTTTTNGAKAFKSTLSKTVDLFASIGAMRGKNILPSFALAYSESKDVAVRTALWARDGYMMMSAGLHDTMTQEQNEGESDSGWGTARIIKKMFGTQAAWAAKVAAEYGNPPLCPRALSG